MVSGRKSSILVCGLVAFAATGCGDSSNNQGTSGPSATAPTATPSAGGYVTQVNGLCAQLLSQVLAFDIGNAPTIEEFQRKRTELNALIKTFDADVAAIPVTAGDRPAAAAFDAYRRFSDATDARLAAAAATGDQRRFDAENEAVLSSLQSSSELNDLRATGIQCQAR